MEDPIAGGVFLTFFQIGPNFFLIVFFLYTLHMYSNTCTRYIMIQLRDFFPWLFENTEPLYNTESTSEKRSVWRVDPEDTSVVSYAGRNSYGQVRYFSTQEKANKYARGEIKGKHPGRPIPKIKPTQKLRKQTYRTRND
jgi:hypothetical protein